MQPADYISAYCYLSLNSTRSRYMCHDVPQTLIEDFTI